MRAPVPTPVPVGVPTHLLQREGRALGARSLDRTAAAATTTVLLQELLLNQFRQKRAAPHPVSRNEGRGPRRLARCHDTRG